AKCQVSRSPSRKTRPAEDSAKWVVKTSALVSAAWLTVHWRDFRAASGNSQNTEFQSGLTNCSGWCITSPQNSVFAPGAEADAGVVNTVTGAREKGESFHHFRAVHNDLLGQPSVDHG